MRACQHEANRALQGTRCQDREHHVVLRTQAAAEGAADKGRDNPNIIRVHLEHAAQVALYVLHSLRLVMDGELAPVVPDHGGGVHFHRIVVLGRDTVFGLVTHVGRGERRYGIAARL